MKVYNYDGQIINADNDDPQIDRMIAAVEDRDALILEIEAINAEEIASNSVSPSLMSIPPKIEFNQITVDFGGLESYADNSNTTEINGSWVFNPAGISDKIASNKAVYKSSVEDRLVDLSIRYDKAYALNLIEKADSIQRDINLTNAELSVL